MAIPESFLRADRPACSPWPVPVTRWNPGAYHKALAPDAVEIFSPNHVGFYVLSCPLPPERQLAEFSCVMRFMTPVDYDFSGMAINHPPHKKNLFGLSRRNGTFEACNLFKGPYPVQLDTPYKLSLVRDRANQDSATPQYRFAVDGRDLVSHSLSITHIGVFVCEAHVQIENVTVLLSPPT